MGYTARHPSGYYTIESTDTGKLLDEGDTLTCVHCGHVWHVKPGSGRVRGWCALCGGPTCGHKACDTCAPLERRIEMAERRAALNQRMARERGV